MRLFFRMRLQLADAPSCMRQSALAGMLLSAAARLLAPQRCSAAAPPTAGLRRRFQAAVKRILDCDNLDQVRWQPVGSPLAAVGGHRFKCHRTQSLPGFQPPAPGHFLAKPTAHPHGAPSRRPITRVVGPGPDGRQALVPGGLDVAPAGVVAQLAGARLPPPRHRLCEVGAAAGLCAGAGGTRC
jgi:hypothetical protein